MTDKFISLITGILTGLCAFWVYYRLFRGTGLKFGIIVSVLLSGFSFFSPVSGKLLAFILFSIGIVIELIINTQKRGYAHSQFVFEGGGIRRGLTPVEVGVLFKVETNDLFVLTLIDLIQKEFVEYRTLPDGGVVVNLRDDLESSQIILNPKLRRKNRKDIAFTNLRHMTDTEDALLELVAENVNQSLGNYSIQPWVDYLHRQVENKLSGYEVAQTRDYYLDFVNHRLSGVEEGHFDPSEYFGWMVLGMLLNERLSNLALGLIKNSHPSWIHEGESFINWLMRLKSIAW